MRPKSSTKYAKKEIEVIPRAEFIRVTARVRPSASGIPQERVLELVDEKNLRADGIRKNTHDVGNPPCREFYARFCTARLIPHACEAHAQKLCIQAAEKGENFKYEVLSRFVELYNEDFYDLLGNSQRKQAIRSDSKVVQIVDASEHTVQSNSEVISILKDGWAARRTAATAMNPESSRSHAILIIEIRSEELDNAIVNKKTAILNLVDLAGSERQAKQRLSEHRETANINKSLNLGRVIRALAKSKQLGTHVPYRDSKLTHILRDFLGGNSRTAFIVALHPDKRNRYRKRLKKCEGNKNHVNIC